MADNPNPELPGNSREGRPPEEFPAPSFPTIFADLVWSATHTAEVVKLYLARIDPNAFGRGGAVGNPFVQIIMPTSGFIATAVFFQQKLDTMIEQGVITQQQVDDAKSAASPLQAIIDKPEAANVG